MNKKRHRQSFMLHIFPRALPCASVTCIPRILEMPLLESVPKVDAAGVFYGTDIFPTQGFFFLILSSFFVTNFLKMISR